MSNTFPVNTAIYHEFSIYNADGTNVNADSTPALLSLAKNGGNMSTTGVTVGSLTSTVTGLYYISFNPWPVAVGDVFTFRIRTTVGGTHYYRSFNFVVVPSSAATPPTVLQIRTEMDNSSSKLNQIVEDTGTTLNNKLNTLQSNLNSKPTINQFEARTLPTNSYFNATLDTIANVTNVNAITNKTNFSLSNAERINIATSIATRLFVSPNSKLAIDGSGQVTTANPGGGGSGITQTELNDSLNTQNTTINSHTTAQVGNINPLNAAGIRTAIGLATANMDTQILAIIGAANSAKTLTAGTIIAIATTTDERLLDGGDATDMIAGIVSRIDNTNINEAVFVGLVRDDIERVGGKLDQVLSDTNELQADDTPAAIAALVAKVDAAKTVVDNIPATLVDLSGLSTHDAAAVAAEILVTPSQKIVTNTDGKVLTSNPSAGSGSNHTAEDVASLILEIPANKLATDADGKVTTENPGGGGTGVTPGELDIALNSQNTTINDYTAARVAGNQSLDKLGIRQAIGMATANIDVQISGLSTHSSDDVAGKILVTPAQKIVTNADGKVMTSNPAATGGIR